MLQNFIQRIQNFRAQWEWFSPFMASPAAALTFLIRARKSPLTEAHGAYNRRPFHFRGCDITALKEVLVDKEYAFLNQFLKSHTQPVIADVGAHVGTFALWCLQENPAAQITSVEADPKTFRLLSDNCNNRKNSSVRWECLNRAAWKDNFAVNFSDAGDAMSHKVSGNGTVQVQGITLADLVNQTGKINLMKVDIEGAEESFLCAYPDSLSNIDTLVIELHPALCDTQKVHELLNKHFTTIEEIKWRISSKPLLFCKK
jgi:FkbM family methyltransferase